MLHVFTPHAGPDLANEVLRAMFAARKSVFVDLLKWDVPVLAGRYEIDRFDNGHAAYLVLADAHGAHLASVRLLPTTRPHILDSFYADLCDQALPHGTDVFEITRFCLDRRLRAAPRREARDTLVMALAQYALENGIAAYSAVAPTGWARQIVAFGWHAAMLGRPAAIGGEELAALRIDIAPETPHLLAAAGIRPAGEHSRTRCAAA
ncbi:acyl-homoserine-lactone synthase [Novosphingobium endophyticum]|uniref:Acyl-homoserine-lactone synthase n=1 Tax=Novosphingobium endophyticum TaxID=1955250 RepID=A0A916TTI9_9SPHN|nr:acyl-homoserine-lactone synthase [Novosphingobium endophyticum]GGC05019.1 acyl-homoserine-lactone synthase [Novosphingobium endophyticum]